MAQPTAASLPRAVRRQARKAEAAHEKIYGKDGQPPVPAPESAAAPNVVALAAQESQEEPLSQPPSGEVSPNASELEAAPPATPAPAALETPAAEPEAQSSEVLSDAPPPPIEDWEQKYRSLQGMMEREAKQNKRLQNEIGGLQATLAAMSKVRESAPESGLAQGGAPATPARRHLKPEDVETYGQDFIDVMRAAARDEFSPEIERLRTENANLKQQVGGVEKRTVQSEVERVDTFLDAQVPTWRQVNEDPGFLEWLQQVEPFAGQPRQALLDEASKVLNAPRIAAFFTAYLNENQAIRGHQEAPPAPPVQAPVPQSAQRSVPIVDKASLVAPGRPATSGGGGAGAAQDSEEPQFFTESQVTQFYHAVTRGDFKKNPKEKDRIEKAIHKAAAAGRIQPDRR